MPVKKTKLLKPDMRGALTPGEIRAAIHRVCQENNYDPFRELIEMATGTYPCEVNGQIINMPICTVDQKIMIAKEIAPYLAPKLKNIEVTGEVDNKITFTIRKIGGAEKPVGDTGLVGGADVVQRVLQDRILDTATRTKDVLGEVSLDV